MKIGGLQKFSLIDYPGKMAAVVFTQGCNMRCGYCHNPQLVYPDLFQGTIAPRDVLEFLGLRRGKLEGVVVSGGEPTLQSDLSGFLRDIKAMGYQIKLDTNGALPGVLDNLIKDRLVDYIAMDIKAPLNKYSQVCGCDVDIMAIVLSIRLIERSCSDYHFRTTFTAKDLNGDDVAAIRTMLADPRRHLTQDCRLPAVISR